MIFRYLFLVLILFACKSRDDSLVLVAATDVTVETLGKALLAINSSQTKMFVVKGSPQDPDSSGLLKLVYDTNDSSVSFDFSNFKNDLAGIVEPAKLQGAIKIKLTQPLPPGNIERALDQEAVGIAILQSSIDQSARALEADAKSVVERISKIRESCANKDFIKKKDRFGEQDAFSYEYQIECKQFRSKSTSKMTVSNLELSGIKLYADDGYVFMNSILRKSNSNSRTAVSGRESSAAFWTLLAFSAMNKMDAQQRVSFRGADRVYPTCFPNAPKVPKIPDDDPSANAKTAQDLCKYFKATVAQRDCGFSSSSVDPGIALSFANVGTITGSKPDHVELMWGDDYVPAVSVVYEILGNSGFDLTGASAKPYEREILWPAGKKFIVEDAKIAIWKKDVLQFDHLTEAEFKLVGCDETITETDKKRVAYVRVKMKE